MVISTLLWALGVEQSDLLPLGCLKYLDSYLKINFDLGVVVTHQKIKINIMERLSMSPPFPRELCVCLYIIHVVGFLFGSLSRWWAKNIGFVQFSGCSVAIVLRKPSSGGEFIFGIAEILFFDFNHLSLTYTTALNSHIKETLRWFGADKSWTTFPETRVQKRKNFRTRLVYKQVLTAMKKRYWLLH